jgi:CheY-like chemotaxis protein
MHNDMSSNILQQQEQQLQLVQEYKSAARKRILIVNHEDDVSFALKLVLEEERQVLYNKMMNCFEVNSFNDSVLALNNFEKGLYDLLIIAVVMPRMNGFELAKEIRKIDDKVKICFLIAGEIPSKVRFDASSSGQEEGGEGRYLDKFIRLPIENKDLIAQIDRITDS